ncbi:hypothetical protein TWF694_008322 [Orbilia ellipsospora]|uniref:Uncharacterized protein n=1 Tax=Orbilia ellipsospora TaxID=2528407 RepID=A0AAV9XGZ1_9PEZI
MPSENDELLARISQLAGQINRHKTAVASSGSSSRPSQQQQQQQQQASYPTRHQPYPTQHPSHRSYGSNSWAPARGKIGYRSRGRGGGVRMPTHGHRNRTLVLNSSAPASGNSSRGETPTTGTDDETMADANDGNTIPTSASNKATATTVASGSGGNNGGGWVAKRDRHMQLINSSVYGQHLQTRAKAIEQTRQDKLKRKEEREKAKLRNFLQGSKQYGIVNTIGRVKSKPTKVATYQHEIVINGARFKITVDGSKLVKVSGEFLLMSWNWAFYFVKLFYKRANKKVKRMQRNQLQSLPLWAVSLSTGVRVAIFGEREWCGDSYGMINKPKRRLQGLANSSLQLVSFSFSSLKFFLLFLPLVRYREHKNTCRVLGDLRAATIRICDHWKLSLLPAHHRC